MIKILVKIDGKILDETTSKIYPIRSNRTNANGEHYIYKNYKIYIPYEYLDFINATDSVWIYKYKNKVYLTGTQPDGSVLAKKCSVNKQTGSPTSRKYKPNETKNNQWKRTFILPKKIFPNINENQKVLFTLYPNEKEMFSDSVPTITVELTKEE